MNRQIEKNVQRFAVTEIELVGSIFLIVLVLYLPCASLVEYFTSDSGFDFSRTIGFLSTPIWLAYLIGWCCALIIPSQIATIRLYFDKYRVEVSSSLISSPDFEIAADQIVDLEIKHLPLRLELLTKKDERLRTRPGLTYGTLRDIREYVRSGD